MAMVEIKGDGLKVCAEVKGNLLIYQVLFQTGNATNFMKLTKDGIKHHSGFKMKSNARPTYKPDKKIFYMRGYDNQCDNQAVTAEFNSRPQAEAALAALRDMVEHLEELAMPKEVAKNIHNENRFLPGSTSHVRSAIIKRQQAEKLSLTGHKFFPQNRTWKVTPAIVTVNAHFNEHIGQVVDVLNKAQTPGTKTKGAVKPHKVSHEQAEAALNAVRELFDNAEAGDYLVAIWRLVTGLRGPDFVDEEPANVAAAPE